MTTFDERDATLRYNICAELIRTRHDWSSSDIISAATDIYKFVTRTGNSPAIRKVSDDEIPC